MDKEILDLLETNRPFIKFPENLKGKYTKKELEKLMKFEDNEIPIEEVVFMAYPPVRGKIKCK